MIKVAIAYLTRDRVELVKQSLPPLLDSARKNQHHLFVIDGSKLEASEKAIWELAYPTAQVHSNVRGGAGAAIVYALTMMLQHNEHYDYVGLCESDVLLHEGWFDPTFALFERGAVDGLEVGAVSTRCYSDRILFQRERYAICLNLGAGQIIFSRRAAEAVLNNFRTAWTSDNRRVFAQLCGQDIGMWWAFRMNEHNLTADFHWEPVLASLGMAAVALTPSPVEMIGQNPPLAEQGLTIVTEFAIERCNDAAFHLFQNRLEQVRKGQFQLGVSTQFHFNPHDGTWTYFPHQMHMIGGEYQGDWRLRECRGWGTFSWVAGDGNWYDRSPQGDGSRPTRGACGILTVPIFGPCSVLISGGKSGGKVEVCDEGSGFKASPDLPPEGENAQVLNMQIPGGIAYRNIRITALTPGVVFYGIQTRDKQPSLPGATFDYSMLPKP